MNLLLLEQDDLMSPQQAQISGRRLQHMLDVHQIDVGKKLKAGLIDGQMGTALVTAITETHVALDIDLHTPPPSALPITMILALPRPKMMRRVLQTIATMGVKQLYLINSYRVEKSFWQSPWLTPDKIREQLILGLEQGCDTVLPSVHLCKRFKPFVEDQLPSICVGKLAIVAHPKTNVPCPIDLNKESVLVIGPEGGLIPYEIEKLEECGFSTFTLGPRILRVETAIPSLLSRLYP
jgi:16S rRNA (uracil1498-N3)-methyltransferase